MMMTLYYNTTIPDTPSVLCQCREGDREHLRVVANKVDLKVGLDEVRKVIVILFVHLR